MEKEFFKFNKDDMSGSVFINKNHIVSIRQIGSSEAEIRTTDGQAIIVKHSVGQVFGILQINVGAI